MNGQPLASSSLVIVGSQCIGKTCLLSALVSPRIMSRTYMPTVMSRVLIQTSQGTLEIEDTSGDPELDRLRPMGYSEAKMVLVAFAIDSRASFLDVQDKWLPEITFYRPSIPWILVGTRQDARQDPDISPESLVSLEEGRDLAIQRMALFYVETSSMLCTGTTDLIDTVWEALGSVARSVWPKTSTSLTETSSMDSTLDAGSEDEQDSALLAPAQEIAQNMDAKPSLHSHTDSTHSKSQLSSPPSSPPQKSSYPDRPQQRSNQGHMQVRADFLDLPNERGRIDMLQTRSVTSGGGILQDTRPALDPSFSMDSGKVFSHQEDRYLDNDRVSIEYFPPSSHPRPAYPPDKRRKSGWKSFFKNFSQGQEQQHSQKQKYSMPPQSQYSLPARQSLQRPVPVQYQYHQHTQHTQPMQYMQSQNRRSMGEMRSQKTNFWTKLFGPRNGV